MADKPKVIGLGTIFEWGLIIVRYIFGLTMLLFAISFLTLIPSNPLIGIICSMSMFIASGLTLPITAKIFYEKYAIALSRPLKATIISVLFFTSIILFGFSTSAKSDSNSVAIPNNNVSAQNFSVPSEKTRISEPVKVCPKSCDDNDSTTMDYCGVNTSFVCQHKVLSIEELRKISVFPSYSDLYKNPSSYSGKVLSFKGVVVQSGDDFLRVATNANNDQIVYVTYSSKEKFNDAEWVEIIGMGGQNKKYTAVLGNTIEIPAITAKDIRSLPFDEIPTFEFGQSAVINDHTVINVSNLKLRHCGFSYSGQYVDNGYYMVVTVDFTNPASQGNSAFVSASDFSLIDNSSNQYSGSDYFATYTIDSCNDAVDLKSGYLLPKVHRQGEVWFKLGSKSKVAMPAKIVYDSGKAIYSLPAK